MSDSKISTTVVAPNNDNNSVKADSALPKPTPAPAPTTTEHETSASTFPLFMAGLALMISAISVWGTYWFYKQNNRLATQIDGLTDGLSTQISSFQSALSNETLMLNQLGETLGAQQKAIDALPSQTRLLIEPTLQELASANAQSKIVLSQLELRVAQLETAQEITQGLLADLPSQKSLWQMTEVVQLHHRARSALLVERNIPAALTALELSFEILRAINVGDSGALLKRTEQIIQDLRGQESNDPARRMALFASLQEALQEIPLIDDRGVTPSVAPADLLTQSTNSTLPWYRALWQDVLSELFRLVRYTPQERALVPPDGEFFLRQNFLLSLQTLRSSLLRHDRVTATQESQQLANWVRQYGQAGDKQKTILDTLTLLQSHGTINPTTQNAMQSLVVESQFTLSRIQQGQGKGGRP